MFNRGFSKSKEPIFIGGEGRSGTTLMRAIINSHPNIICGSETHCFTNDSLKEYYRQCKEGYRARIAEFDPDPEHKINLMFQSMFNNFFGEYAKTHNKARWADKTPYNIKSIDFYLDVFEGNIKFIHMIRDGRDVALSMLGMTWGPQTVEDAANSWKDIILESRKHVGKPYFIEIKYEDLIRSPAETVKRVCHLLGERYYPKMLDESSRDVESGRSESSYSQIVRPLYGSSVYRWKKEMDNSQLKSFMSIAGDVIVDLGYDES